MNNYRLSMYKYKGSPRESDLVPTLVTEDYFELEEGRFFVYFSPHIGILVKNLSTKITERFDNNLKVKFLRAIGDSNDKMLLVYTTEKDLVIKIYDTEISDYKTIIKNKTFNNYFLIKHDSISFIVYLNSVDNNIYCLSSLDNFSEAVLLHNRSFNKQAIMSVGYDTINELPFVFLEVIDNTLLRGIDKHLNLNNNRFVEIFTDHRLFHKEIPVG